MLDTLEQSVENRNQWSYDLPYSLINVNAEDRQAAADEENEELDSRQSKLMIDSRKKISPHGKIILESQPMNNNHYHFRSAEHQHGADKGQNSRGLSPEAIQKITETLGAINTVGRYLVNYTRGAASPTDLFVNNEYVDQEVVKVRSLK